MLALLSLPDVKHALVVDHDVDIFDATALEWARTFCVQADQDVVIVQGAHAKHIDPSVRAWELPKSALPMTAKMGLDATIPEGAPRELYERIQQAFVAAGARRRGVPGHSRSVGLAARAPAARARA